MKSRTILGLSTLALAALLSVSAYAQQSPASAAVDAQSHPAPNSPEAAYQSAGSPQTLMETVLLSVSRQAVMYEIECNRDFCIRMLAGLSRRLHGLISDVEAYALQSGAERVIGYLLRGLPELQPSDDASGKSVSITLPASKAAIASRLSMTPEYFSRVLHELENRGLIVVDRREITIPNPARLLSLPTAETQTHSHVPEHLRPCTGF